MKAALTLFGLIQEWADPAPVLDYPLAVVLDYPLAFAGGSFSVASVVSNDGVPVLDYPLAFAGGSFSVAKVED